MSEPEVLFYLALSFTHGAILAAIFVNARFKPKCDECEKWWEQIKHHKRAIKQLHKYPRNGDTGSFKG